MPEDASPRASPIRRTLIAIGRAAGLLALIAGIYSILVVAAPRLQDVSRSIIALVAGVSIFELLRPSRKSIPAAAAVPAVISDGSTAELGEARALIERLRDESIDREAALRRDSEELIAINDGLRREIAGLGEVLAAERAAAAETRVREERLREQATAESEHLQRAAGKALDEVQQMRNAADELRAEAERERLRVADAVQEAGDVKRENETVRAESQRERQRADQFRHEVQAATQENEKVRAESQRERQRADQAVRELQNALSSAASAATQRQKLESQIAELDRRLTASMQELEALRAERQRVRREIEEIRQRAEVEKGELRLSVEAAANAKLQETVNKLTAGHDAAMRAEVAAQRASLEREIAALRASAVDEKALRESIDAEWSAKMNKIVADLAKDHETEIGDAIAAREEARAEARAVNGRNLEIERQLERARQGRLELLQRDDEMSRELESEKQVRARLEEEIAALREQMANMPVIDEKALRESIDAEWSAKLQTIVSHIATDHEADVGKAIEEREAARAEARNLAMKIGSLQTKLRAAEEQIAVLRNAPPPLPEAAVDEVRARAEVLEVAEQASAAIRAATSPGDVPLPAERRARVLFVHHDPTMRTMWRDNLDQSGFDVQTAADGLEGLRLTVATKPDVVIADASMPKMGGRELCQLIKSNQETATVKVILMTGVYTNDVPAESSAHQFEADELLRKPVKFEALKAALSNLLAAV